MNYYSEFGKNSSYTRTRANVEKNDKNKSFNKSKKGHLKPILIILLTKKAQMGLILFTRAAKDM